jgi:hypothetical protein
MTAVVIWDCPATPSAAISMMITTVNICRNRIGRPPWRATVSRSDGIDAIIRDPRRPDKAISTSTCNTTSRRI